MEEQLRKLAEIYYGRVQTLADMLGKLIEPLIIGVLGGLFAFLSSRCSARSTISSARSACVEPTKEA